MKSKILGLVVVGLLAASSNANANLVINGSFEDNSAAGNVYNPTNAQFNALVPNVTAFGVRQGMDLQTVGSPYGLAPQDGDWKVSPASDQGGDVEAFSMGLGSALVAGTSYTLSFYIERLFSGVFDGGSVEVGLSNSSTDFGTLIAGATAPLSGWLLSTTDFSAPFAATYLTVRVTNASDSWVGLDNFSLIRASTPSVPEPGTLALLGLGLAGLGMSRGRKAH